MSNLVPIQITLQAATAADAKQLVQDLASTMFGMADTRIPASTEVSTLTPAAPATVSQQPQQFTPQNASARPPQQGYTAPTVPTAQPNPTAPPALPAGAVPTSAPSYTMEQLGVAAQPLVDAGRGPELVGWLQQHGVSALTQLPKEKYGEFATFLRSLGASI
ncbi:hypothetical protein [Paenibacillus barengoltzii]|uniref:hypothetical protein n=1 Tax=Paenibacillus barengoltzii TaxID=343517 RepID=UPI000FD87E12|nr:hypothetical protein [Paenibacillus barengoltzii]